MRENPKNIKKLLISVFFVGCAHHKMFFEKLSLRLAFDRLKLESVFFFHVRVLLAVDLLEEHSFWANPKCTILIELPVYNNVLPSLRVLRDRLNKIIIALEMSIYSADQNFTHKNLLVFL